MKPVCIITDNTAQFPQPSFPGRNLIRIIPFTTEINGRKIEQAVEVKPGQLPSSVNSQKYFRLLAPSPESFANLFQEINISFRETVCIFLSSGLSQCFSNARSALESQHSNSIHLIDSQTTSIGLGILVQTAAEAATQGKSAIEIDSLIRSMIPKIYAVFSISGLSYLYFNGFIDKAQAFVSEMLGLYTIFSLEEGRLNPVGKVRNHRHIIDFFQEFMDEFDHLQHIALVQGSPANPQDSHLVREYIQQNFPGTPFTAHPINLPLASLLGPRSLGLFVAEDDHSYNH